jgi:hypothetical protein
MIASGGNAVTEFGLQVQYHRWPSCFKEREGLSIFADGIDVSASVGLLAYTQKTGVASKETSPINGCNYICNQFCLHPSYGLVVP